MIIRTSQAAMSSDKPLDYNHEYITVPVNPRSVNEIEKFITYRMDKKIQKLLERDRSKNAVPSKEDFCPITGAQYCLKMETATP